MLLSLAALNWLKCCLHVRFWVIPLRTWNEPQTRPDWHLLRVPLIFFDKRLCPKRRTRDVCHAPFPFKWQERGTCWVLTFSLYDQGTCQTKRRKLNEFALQLIQVTSSGSATETLIVSLTLHFEWTTRIHPTWSSIMLRLRSLKKGGELN